MLQPVGFVRIASCLTNIVVEDEKEASFELFLHKLDSYLIVNALFNVAPKVFLMLDAIPADPFFIIVKFVQIFLKFPFA